jgi:hypothetical protein
MGTHGLVRGLEGGVRRKIFRCVRLRAGLSESYSSPHAGQNSAARSSTSSPRVMLDRLFCPIGRPNTTVGIIHRPFEAAPPDADAFGRVQNPPD